MAPITVAVRITVAAHFVTVAAPSNQIIITKQK